MSMLSELRSSKQLNVDVILEQLVSLFLAPRLYVYAAAVYLQKGGSIVHVLLKGAFVSLFPCLFGAVGPNLHAPNKKNT